MAWDLAAGRVFFLSCSSCRFATYRDDGLLVIGAIVEGIMALRVGHYSTAGPLQAQDSGSRQRKAKGELRWSREEQELEGLHRKTGHGLRV